MPGPQRQQDIRSRHARREDLGELARLMLEHAAFEKAAPPTATSASLNAAIFGSNAALHVWVATVDETIVGYLSATREFSTWSCAPFLHMDCLYVAEAHRNSGAGVALFDCLRAFARELGVQEIQWQTPDWNTRAAEFYRRLGAAESAKRRFRLSMLEHAAGEQDERCA